MRPRTPPRPVTPVAILAEGLREVVDSGLVPDAETEVAALARLAEGLDPYLEALSSPESPELAALAQATTERDWPARSGDGVISTLEQEMLSGHVEGKLLAFLVRLLQARRVLEIGMFTGYAALAMAEALKGDGVVVALEIDPDVASFARRQFDRSPAGERIEILIGPAAESLRVLQGRFDLVFLDADKGGYLEYLEILLERDLLAPNGLICVDNTLYQGEPWTGGSSAAGEAIAAFNRAVAVDERLEQVLIPLRDGLTLIRRC